MSSKAGPRAEGTDGSDWKHREKVAYQYIVSVKYKNAMKRTVLYHGILGTAIIVTSFLCGLNALYSWQVLWMLGIPGCLFGFKGICKNSITQINIYKFLLSAVSVPAIIWGIVATLGYIPHQPIYTFLNLPQPKLYMMPASDFVIYFLGGTTLMSHIFSIVAIGRLANAWDTTTRKPKSN